MLGKRKWSENNPLTSMGLVMGVGAAAAWQVWHARRLESPQEVQCLEASQEVQCCLCNEKSATWFNLPCSHGGYCQGCLQKAEQDRKKMPNCQQCGKKIVGVIDDNLGGIRSHD